MRQFAPCDDGSMKSLRAYAPATIGNFAAGFDLLGAALAPLDGSLLGDVVAVCPSDCSEFRLEGSFAQAMAGESRPNLVLRTAELFQVAAAAHGVSCGPVSLSLEKNLPLASGMGSSASSIVATIVALQALWGSPLAREELLSLAARAEGLYSGAAHLDNVAPALLGGIQLAVPGLGDRLDCREVPWPLELRLVLVHPHFPLATAASRAVLPPQLPMAGAVAFAGNLAGLIQALHSRDWELLARSLRDPLAEPYRAPLVPGFRQVQGAAREAGALGCTLSGSGPSVFAVAGSAEAATAILAAMREEFLRGGLGSDGWICRIDPEGARLLA